VWPPNQKLQQTGHANDVISDFFAALAPHFPSATLIRSPSGWHQFLIR